MGRLRLKFDPGNPIAQCHSLTKPAHNSPRSHCLCSLEGREENGSHHLPQIQPSPLGTPTLSHRSEMDAVMQQRGRRVIKVYLEGMDRERRKGCNVAWEFEQTSKYVRSPNTVCAIQTLLIRHPIYDFHLANDTKM